MFFHKLCVTTLKSQWGRHIITELQIGPSPINKQELDTLVTAMFYHFLTPEGGHPTWEEKYQNARPFFWATLVKQWDVVSKSAANIYLSNKYDIFPVLFSNHETLYNLNIVWASTTFWANHRPFLQLQACGLLRMLAILSS